MVKHFILLFLLCFFLAASSFAQTGTLNGRILNDANEPLSGATIILEGKGKTVAADVEGRFVFRLAAGTYAIIISRVGYTTKNVSDVIIKANEENAVEVVLQRSKSNELDVTVRSSIKRESTNALIAFQKNNTAMSSGIAADFIRRTPDKNTGEVLKRVSGASIQDNKYVIVRGLSDRYNQAMINNALMPSSEPDKKAFSFDLIPSTMIDNIIINKTATPDLPGEFAGGLVQVNTRDIPTRNVLTVGVSIGYNSQSTFKPFTSNGRSSTDWLGFDNGDRSLPSSIPSKEDYRSLTDAQKIEITKEFKGDVYAEQTKTALPITTVTLSWSDVRNFKNGGKFGSVVSLYHRNAMVMYDDVERGRFEFVRSPIFSGTETQNRYSVNGGVLANFSYVKGRHKISLRNIFNQFYEDNYFTRNLNNTGRLQIVNLRSSFVNQRSLYSGQLEGEHQLSTSGVKFVWNGNFSYNNKSQPDFRVAQYVRSSDNPNSNFEMDDDDTRRFFSTLNDYSAGGNAALTIPIKIGDLRQIVKVGGSTLVRFRDFNARVFRYRPASTNTDIRKTFDQAFLPGNINSNGLYLDEQTQNTDNYFGISALNAGYVMFDNKLSDKLRVIWGGRVEFFEQFLSSRDLSLKRIVVNKEKTDFLPSINATYSINNKNQLRGAVSKTVARPEFREIAPFQFFDYEQIWGISGDTALRRTSIINADLRYEYYPKAGEVLSVGVFYKNFTDPIELRRDAGSNGDRWLFAYSNAASAKLLGVEVEVRKDLDFVSSKLKDLTFIGNLTLLDSKVTLNTQQADGKNVEQDRPLFGQSPYLINAGFQYTSGLWNASALYNRIGPRLALVGDPNGAGFFDIYERPRNVVDLLVSKKILKEKGELRLTISDLLNNRFAFYDNPSVKAGYNFDQGDRINYAYRAGTTITIGFNYDIERLTRK